MISNFYSRAFQIDTKLYTYTFPFILYPLNHISFLASIYITVAMAYERYIAVCRPLHYRDVTTRYTVQRRTIGYAAIRFIEVAISNIIIYFLVRILYQFSDYEIYIFRYILPVIFLSIVLNIPKFLEPKLVWMESNSTNPNNSSHTFPSEGNLTNEAMVEKEYEIGK